MAALAHLRSNTTYRNMSSFIKSKSDGKPIYFIPSPGNWGDALINHGSLQFFRYYGIEHKTLSREKLESMLQDSSASVAVETVVVGGGGGWCANWNSTPEFVNRISHRNRTIIVLPTSLALPVEVANNVHLYRRDNSESLEIYPTSKFCHDMAFFVDIPSLQGGSELWRLHAFRTDIERNPNAVDVKNSIDISLLGNAGHDVRPFFELINRFKEVYTDRLHVAIAGAMLRKKVRLFPGNYAKANAVWSASLEQHYETVTLASWS